ncbi:leukocyte antigen CD37 isoform X1 [Colossoma macropomum]|uniref:leukocyte antigen CD37 isoform X1 n=1 Tax=Colossoma macropomum TaxID=42526 RepID=UPI0018650301|nr:leukocyte antigen CD37 isoform X1 [Colossoma macropomum]
MASEFCLSLTKYFLFVFNLVFFFLGSALLSLGLWIMFSETSVLIPAPRFISLSLFSYLLIISGVVTISLGFFGSLGALKEVKCMLAIYFILLTVLLVAQTMGGVLLITQKSVFEKSLESHVQKLIQDFGKNDSNLRDFERTLLVLQREAKCCGWSGPLDWKPDAHCSCYSPNNVTANITDHNDHSDIHTCNITTWDKHKKGCKEYVEEWLSAHILIILMVVFVLAVVECLQWVCLVTFCCLSHSCRCCRLRKPRGSHVQLSRDFNVEYWQDKWFDPFDVSV